MQGGGCALLMEQGCGKSLTAIAIMGRAFLNGLIKKVLIVAPSSVVPAWTKDEFGEFALHANFPYEVKALTGPVERRIFVLQNWAPDARALQVAVVNYEAVWRMEEELAKWKPDMIICDESQRIKTPSTRQSKSMHKLGGLTKYRLILTGTPVTQGPLDLFSQYKFLDPSIFGNSYVNFRNKYAILGGPNKNMVIAYRNLPDLVEKAHRVAFRVTKEEALDLPEFTDQELYCELEPGAKRIYEQMRKQSVAEIMRLLDDTLEINKVIAQNVLTRLLRLSQITGGFVIPEGGGIQQVSSAKFVLLRETLNDLLEAGKKVVVFARFIPEIRTICNHLDKDQIQYSLIYGDIPQGQRGEMVTKFQQDPNCKVFVAQIQTAGLGITLTAADTAIFYSLDYSYANYDQCRARIHRIGQKNACTYIHLLAQDTVDEKVVKVLRGKKSVADAVVNNWREFL